MQTCISHRNMYSTHIVRQLEYVRAATVVRRQERVGITHAHMSTRKIGERNLFRVYNIL